jgi:hypothetical protein
MKFHAPILLAGKTATGIEVPPAAVEGVGSGKKPTVRVTIGGHTYRSTVAARGGRFLIGVSAENREKATGTGEDRRDSRPADREGGGGCFRKAGALSWARAPAALTVCR